MAFATLWYDYEVQCRLYDNLLTLYLLKNAILLLENIPISKWGKIELSIENIFSKFVLDEMLQNWLESEMHFL